MNKKTILVLTALSSTLVGCVNAPKGLEKEQFTLKSLSSIQQSDYSCQCKSIRLGGKVLTAQALPNKTKIEVLSYPVYSTSAKPMIDEQPNGRFITYLDGFVEPQSLKDQFITIGGTLLKTEQGKVDQASYTYPVIQTNHYRVWKLSQSYYYPDDMWDDWGFFGRRPYYWYGEPEIRYYLY